MLDGSSNCIDTLAGSCDIDSFETLKSKQTSLTPLLSLTLLPMLPSGHMSQACPLKPDRGKLREPSLVDSLTPVVFQITFSLYLEASNCSKGTIAMLKLGGFQCFKSLMGHMHPICRMSPLQL